jgi:hypothetical protein
VGQPVFFTSAALHDVAAFSKRTDRKAASQGSEITRRWRAWAPKKSGWYRGIDGQGRIVCDFDDGSQYPYWQWRNWPTRWNYLEVGARIEAGETMVAGIVEPPSSLTCPGAVWNVGADLQSEDATTIYAAVKAAGILGDEGLLDALVSIAEQAGGMDWRVRLEAYASLARLDPTAWTEAIANIALNSEAHGEQRMEAAFILSEIPTDDAARAMADIAASGDESIVELRAAAVWGLGRGVRPRPDLVLPFAADPNDLIGLHAIVALQRIPAQLLPTLVAWLQADDRHAASAATILARYEQVQALLTAVDAGGRARLWALQALGSLPPEVVRAKAAGRLIDAVERQLEPLWISQSDWLRGEARDGLEALAVQTVRFDPVRPG